MDAAEQKRISANANKPKTYIQHKFIRTNIVVQPIAQPSHPTLRQLHEQETA
jgi:hypothetical protein